MLRKKNREAPDIPTSSMSDIVFLLLVFFLVTTSFNMEKGLDLLLPPKGGEQEIRKERITKIQVDAVGRMQVISATGRERVNDIEMIYEMALAKLDSDSGHIFVIQIDRDGNYQNMISVLDQLKKADAKKIALATSRQD